MIARGIINKVIGLLAEGKLTQRQIAKIVGISRGTVNAMALGKRHNCPAPPTEPDWEDSIGPYERCLVCGGMVTKPCRVCKTRERMRKQ